MARSNVSNSLRELQNWGIVHNVHVLGDRRDHYESDTDVWVMFQKILDERKRREIDPTLNVLRQCQQEARENESGETVVRERLQNICDFLETMSSWYDQMRHLPTSKMVGFFRMGTRVRKFLGVASARQPAA